MSEHDILPAYSIRVETESGVLDLPARRHPGGDGASFVAEHPPLRQEEKGTGRVEVKSVCLLEEGRPVVRFAGVLSLGQTERGVWTVREEADEFGRVRYGLEYHAREEYGARRRDPALFTWDRQREEMLLGGDSFSHGEDRRRGDEDESPPDSPP
jgi:hypothetical protein